MARPKIEEKTTPPPIKVPIFIISFKNSQTQIGPRENSNSIIRGTSDAFKALLALTNKD
jgi:hypothetical protein